MYSIFPFVLPKTTWLNTYLAHISTVLAIVSSQKVPEDAIWMSYANTLLLIFICFQGAGDRVWGPTHGNSTCKAPPTLLFYRRLGILRCPTTNLPCVKRDPCMPRGTAFSATVRSRQSPPLSSLPPPPPRPLKAWGSHDVFKGPQNHQDARLGYSHVEELLS